MDKSRGFTELSGKRPVLLTLPAQSEYLGLARVAAATYAAMLPFSVAELEELKVAVSEAVTNAIRHGYPTGEGEVTLLLDQEDGLLRLEVADRGVGLEETAAAAPEEGADAEQMGLGFAFMRSFMDRIEIESARGQGTRVRMWKRPAGSGVDG